MPANVRISFRSGTQKIYPARTTVAEIVNDPEVGDLGSPIVGALVNNELVCLSSEVEVDSHLEAVGLQSREGTYIYRRSLCLLLAMATAGLASRRRLVISHSLGDGYFYYFDGLDHIPDQELDLIRRQMRRLVAADVAFTAGYVSYLDALRYFEENNQRDTVMLLENANEAKVRIYRCGDFIDLYHGPLVPSSGILKEFQIMNYPPGFLLRFPQRQGKIGAFAKRPLLFAIYREYKSWGKILNVSCAGRLNQLVREGQIDDFVQVSEALHDKKIARIADMITQQRCHIRVVLVAGPSSSGKTTFSKKLAIQLRVLGRNPITVSLDDYFLPRDLSPRDEAGNYNFEDLEALDIELLNAHLVALLDGLAVSVPRFDFRSGTRRTDERLFALPERGVLIIEGIHGLNEELTPSLERKQKFKIYVSALTQLNLDDHNRISTTDNRLLRRVVRDNQFRGHPAQRTLNMWPSVRRGEDRNIFPFQDSSDAVFNSALDYEHTVLRVFAEPLLRTVRPDARVYQEARRLLTFLGNFAPLSPSWVPSRSILREFIGGSAFRY